MNKYIENGEKYLINCLIDGLAHSYSVNTCKYVKAYPEVTGYVIKYFCDYWEEIPDKIIVSGNRLLSMQDAKNGGWSSFANTHILYVFDTAQIVGGLRALYLKTNDVRYLNSSIRGADFIVKSLESNGALKPIYNCQVNGWVLRDETYSLWNGPYSGLMNKTVECLVDMFETTKYTRYIESARKISSFYKNAQYIEYTHPLGYWLEGLWKMQEVDLIDKTVTNKILPRICESGYISYDQKTNYAYVSGVIQIGIILYKMGYINEAKIIRNYGRKVQSNHDSGGLFQYANDRGELVCDIHDEINSWGTKYFCELERLINE